MVKKRKRYERITASKFTKNLLDLTRQASEMTYKEHAAALGCKLASYNTYAAGAGTAPLDLLGRALVSAFPELVVIGRGNFRTEPTRSLSARQKWANIIRQHQEAGTLPAEVRIYHAVVHVKNRETCGGSAT